MRLRGSVPTVEMTARRLCAKQHQCLIDLGHLRWLRAAREVDEGEEEHGGGNEGVLRQPAASR